MTSSEKHQVDKRNSIFIVGMAFVFGKENKCEGILTILHNERDECN